MGFERPARSAGRGVTAQEVYSLRLSATEMGWVRDEAARSGLTASRVVRRAIARALHPMTLPPLSCGAPSGASVVVSHSFVGVVGWTFTIAGAIDPAREAA